MTFLILIRSERLLSNNMFNENEIKNKALECLSCPNPTCIKGCPIGINIRDFIKLIKEDKLDAANKLIMKTTPLSFICGTVCDHKNQCEGNCIKNKINKPVNIGDLHAYIANYKKLDTNNFVINKKKKVAIIGAGPAGLTSTYMLRKEGYPVDVYEKESDIGGIPYTQIPNFRLDKNLLKENLKPFYKMGITYHFGKEIKLDEIINQYDAILLATGCQKPISISIPGSEKDNIITSDEFLKDIEINKNYSKYKIFKNPVVMGGGNVAMDSARTINRICGNTTIIYRRSENELPARKDEYQEALKEGVKFSFLTNPKEVLENKLKVIDMKLGEIDESGRASFSEIEGSEHEIPCDLFILAIGNKNDIDKFSSISTNKTFVLTDDKMQTNIDKVFAAGDVVSGSDTVVNAIKNSIIATNNMLEYLKNNG